MNCNKCGSPLGEGAANCNICGEPVNIGVPAYVPPQPPEAIPAPMPPMPMGQSQSQYSAPYSDPYMAMQAAKANSKKKGCMIAGIIVGIIVLIAVTAVIIFSCSVWGVVKEEIGNIPVSTSRPVSTSAPSSATPKLNSTNTPTSGNKRVGRPNFGYVDVPSDWVRWIEQDSTMDLEQWTNGDGYILTMAHYPDIDSVSGMEQRIRDSLEEEDFLDDDYMYIGDHTARWLCYWYMEEDIDLEIYLFVDNDGVGHYISFEGPAGEEYEEYTEIMRDTFDLDR